MEKPLEKLREEIDEIDNEIITLIAKRFRVVDDIGKVKKEKNIPPLDEKRWRKVIEKITQKAKENNVPVELVEKIYKEIHQTALSIEKNHE
jgi:chorismate mutase